MKTIKLSLLAVLCLTSLHCSRVQAASGGSSGNGNGEVAVAKYETDGDDYFHKALALFNQLGQPKFAGITVYSGFGRSYTVLDKSGKPKVSSDPRTIAISASPYVPGLGQEMQYLDVGENSPYIMIQAKFRDHLGEPLEVDSQGRITAQLFFPFEIRGNDDVLVIKVLPTADGVCPGYAGHASIVEGICEMQVYTTKINL